MPLVRLHPNEFPLCGYQIRSLKNRSHHFAACFNKMSALDSQTEVGGLVHIDPGALRQVHRERITTLSKQCAVTGNVLTNSTVNGFMLW